MAAPWIDGGANWLVNFADSVEDDAAKGPRIIKAALIAECIAMAACPDVAVIAFVSIEEIVVAVAVNDVVTGVFADDNTDVLACTRQEELVVAGQEQRSNAIAIGAMAAIAVIVIEQGPERCLEIDGETCDAQRILGVGIVVHRHRSDRAGYRRVVNRAESIVLRVRETGAGKRYRERLSRRADGVGELRRTFADEGGVEIAALKQVRPIKPIRHAGLNSYGCHLVSLSRYGSPLDPTIGTMGISNEDASPNWGIKLR